MKPQKSPLVVALAVGAILIISVGILLIIRDGDSETAPLESTPTGEATPADSATTTGPVVVTFSYEVKSNPPYYLGSGTDIDWEHPGIVVEVLKSLEDALDVEVRFIRNPWERGLRLLEANEVDGVFNASFRPERMEIGVYPMVDGEVDRNKRTFVNSYYLYTLSDSPLEWDGGQINGLTGEIGATLGYSIVGDLQDMGVSVYEGPGQLDNLRVLVQGRIAAVADIGTMTGPLLEAYSSEFEDVVRLEIPLSSKDYYLLLSHQFVTDHPELAQAVWDEIERIRESGEFDQIAENYR